MASCIRKETRALIPTRASLLKQPGRADVPLHMNPPHPSQRDPRPQIFVEAGQRVGPFVQRIVLLIDYRVGVASEQKKAADLVDFAEDAFVEDHVDEEQLNLGEKRGVGGGAGGLWGGGGGGGAGGVIIITTQQSRTPVRVCVAHLSHFEFQLLRNELDSNAVVRLY